VDTVETSGRLATIADLTSRQLWAIAAIVAAVLFGLAGLIGAIGYLVAVSRHR